MDCVELNFADIYDPRNEHPTKKLINNRKSDSNLSICSDFCSALFNCYCCFLL